MNLQINNEQFNALKSRDLAPLRCINCNETFYKPKHLLQVAMKQKNNEHTYEYCGIKCFGNKRKHSTEVICKNCNKTFTKRPAQIKSNAHNFCSRSCSVSYNNKNKTYGTRRSKLETYLEQQIEFHYPELKCQYNAHSIINSELDFYFPTLKLAIELNGIFHYEPIYGQDKLERIQDNDKQKSIQCQNLGIEFCTIDSSSCKSLTQKQKDKYWNIIELLIKQLYNRHSG